MMKNETKDNMKDLAKDVAKDNMKDVAKDNMKDLSKDLAKDVAKDVANELVINNVKDLSKDLAKDLVKDVAKDLSKDLAKDVAKDVANELVINNVKDLSKDLAKDVAKDNANELVINNVKDLSKDLAKDLSRYEYVRSILIPSKIEVYDNGDRQVNVKCIRYSSNNISLNFKNKLKHIYVKCEGIYKIKDFIYEFNSYFINDRLVYRLFKCIQNDTLLKNKMRVIKLLLYQIIHCKNNHDVTTIQYMVYILWLVILNNYDWK